MPVKGSCLLFDTPLKEALFDAVELLAYKNLSSGKPANIQSVYATLRNAGVEVDLPTVGQIYSEVLPRDDASFSNDTEIEDYVGKTWNDEVQRLAELNDLIGEQQIGSQKPEAGIVEFLMKALYGDLVQDARTVSDMKTLQKALQAGIKRKLGKLNGKSVAQKDMVALVNEALSWEQKGITDVNGKLNSIEDLFNGMKAELSKATEDIKNSADANTIERWNEYVKNLETATYKLLFRQADALKVRNDALVAAGFGTKLNGKDVLDWNKLSAFGSLPELRRNAFNALTNAGFSNTVASRVVDTLHDEFIDLRSEIVDKQLANTTEFGAKAKALALENAGLNSLLNGQTMADWIKDQQVETVEDLAKKAYEFLDKTKYIKAVKKSAVDKLTEFFNDTYAKVNNVEATTAIKNIIGDKSAIEWIKENGIQNQQELYDAIDAALSGRNISPQNNLAIKAEFNRVLDINNKAEAELRGREERADKSAKKGYTPRKSDLKRMIELYHLGVFDSTYDSSLYKTLGVSDLQASDLNDIKSVAKVASDLIRKVSNVNGYNLGGDAAVATELQLLQRVIDRIIQRNINNKSTLLKILSYISNYLNVMLSSLLSLPLTLTENILSGFKAVLSGVRFHNLNGAQFKQAGQVYSAMLKDVSRTGQSFGEEIGSFATQELYLNTLRFKWKGASVKEKAESVLLAATMPIRLGLLAFDSANKASLTNKIFYNNIYQSLVKNNLMTKQQAAEFLNEQLYGKSFADAKVLARQIAEERNNSLPLKLRDKITDSYVTRLANDVVKANLFTSGVFQSEDGKKIVDAVVKGSYHVAGIALGHEPNNFFSKGIKNYRDGRKRKEDTFIKDKDWSGLAKYRMGTIAMNNFVIQFAGGATNWMVLRAKEGLFLGFATGGAGQWSKEIAYTDNKQLQSDIISRERARNDIARAAVGLGYAVLFQALGYSLLGGSGDDDDKERLKELKAKKKKTEEEYEEVVKLEQKGSIYREIKANKEKDKWFRKIAPDVHLIKYYMDNSESGDAAGVLNYVARTYMGNEKFSVGGKAVDAISSFKQGDKDAAYGYLSSIVGDKFSVPLYKPYKEYVRVVTNPFREEPIPPAQWVPPTSVQEGLFNGGLLQDLGFFNNPSITAVPGIGPKTLERFKKLGVSNVKELINDESLIDSKDADGFIIDKNYRMKAKKWIEQYKKTR